MFRSELSFFQPAVKDLNRHRPVCYWAISHQCCRASRQYLCSPNIVFKTQGLVIKTRSIKNNLQLAEISITIDFDLCCAKWLGHENQTTIFQDWKEEGYFKLPLRLHSKTIYSARALSRAPFWTSIRLTAMSARIQPGDHPSRWCQQLSMESFIAPSPLPGSAKTRRRASKYLVFI